MKVIEKIHLAGEEFVLALATIADIKLLEEGFARLSKLTKYYRFHTLKKELSSKELNYFLNIDNYNHLAIGAITKVKNTEYGIAMVRYIRDKNFPDMAEVALTVLDTYQHKGLGTQLYKQLLLYASKNEIKTLTHYVLNENTKMIEFLKRFDGKCIQEAYGITKILVQV